MTVDEPHFNGPFVITGLSGAGKTVLSRSLEDVGYICVDNIPLDLVPLLFARTSEGLERLAVVLDIRTPGMIQLFPDFFRDLQVQYEGVRLIFVEASPEILLRRFSVARRPHPLREYSLERAIAEERGQLAAVRDMSDLVFETTGLSPHDLRRQALDLAGGTQARQPPVMEIQSFSYLQGVPATASLVFDVRFLPNPFFDPELRALSGEDERVRIWLDNSSEVADASDRIMDLISYFLPRYAEELKSHLGIAFGCTGGRHRSVYMAERVARELRDIGHDVVVHHRDKQRWRYS